MLDNFIKDIRMVNYNGIPLIDESIKTTLMRGIIEVLIS